MSSTFPQLPALTSTATDNIEEMLEEIAESVAELVGADVMLEWLVVYELDEALDLNVVIVGPEFVPELVFVDVPVALPVTLLVLWLELVPVGLPFLPDDVLSDEPLLDDVLSTLDVDWLPDNRLVPDDLLTVLDVDMPSDVELVIDLEPECVPVLLVVDTPSCPDVVPVIDIELNDDMLRVIEPDAIPDDSRVVLSLEPEDVLVPYIKLEPLVLPEDMYKTDPDELDDPEIDPVWVGLEIDVDGCADIEVDFADPVVVFPASVLL